MKNLIIPILLLALASCSGKSNSEADEIANSKDDQTERIASNYPRHDFTEDNTFKQEWKALSKKFKSVPFVTKTETGNLYLFSDKKNYELPNRYGDKKEAYPNIGLTDSKGNVLLECKYEKIGNPGIIASDYMEIQQYGKYGLFNYKTKQLISPDFDVIFPSAIMGYVGVGQKGTDFFKLYEDGRMIQTTNENEIPSYRKLGKRGNFDITDETIALWINTEYSITKPDEYSEEGGGGMIFTPSYIANMNVINEIVNYISFNYSPGLTQLISETEIIKPRNKSIDSFLKYFHEAGSDGRGYETESRHLVTIDKKNKVIDSKRISENDLNNFKCDGAQYRSVKFLNDSLIEVKENNYNNDENLPYFYMTTCSYYEISGAGEIIPIHEKSHFEMASVVKLTEAHLKGCFSRYLNEEEEEKMQNSQGYDNTVITFHLSLFDLEYMRNEIYARHGFVFKDSKWQSLFAKQSWYRGISNNVDKKLSPLEKDNLKFILEWENKLRGNEEKYTKPEFDTYSEAG